MHRDILMNEHGADDISPFIAVILAIPDRIETLLVAVLQHVKN